MAFRNGRASTATASCAPRVRVGCAAARPLGGAGELPASPQRGLVPGEPKDSSPPTRGPAGRSLDLSMRRSYRLTAQPGEPRREAWVPGRHLGASECGRGDRGAAVPSTTPSRALHAYGVVGPTTAEALVQSLPARAAARHGGHEDFRIDTCRCSGPGLSRMAIRARFHRDCRLRSRSSHVWALRYAGSRQARYVLHWMNAYEGDEWS